MLLPRAVASLRGLPEGGHARRARSESALGVGRTRRCRSAGRILALVDRRRLELVDRDEASWAKQPYHAAEGLPARDARQIVERGLTAARHHATREVRNAVTRLEREGHTIDGCAVLMGQPMPDWSVSGV